MAPKAHTCKSAKVRLGGCGRSQATQATLSTQLICDGILDYKGPLSDTIAPNILAEVNKRSEACRRQLEEKARFFKISGYARLEKARAEQSSIAVSMEFEQLCDNLVENRQKSYLWLARHQAVLTLALDLIAHGYGRSEGRALSASLHTVHVCTVHMHTHMQQRSLVQVAVTKIKTTKISSEGLLRLFTKFSTPENYQPYGITQYFTLL